jgi:phytanoyl-CoA hydroxylase
VIAQRLYRSDRISKPLPGVDAFNEASLEQYRRDGFIAIENVFTPAEVSSAIDGIRQLIIDGNPSIIQFEEAGRNKELSPDERAAYVRKCMWFCKHEARLNALAAHPKLLQVVKSLVGSDVALLQDMALLKPPLVGREKPWHQDSAYFKYGPASLIVGTWTALDEATVENGCMHVIPGSHLEGGKAHYHDRDCQLPDDIVTVEKDVCVPLKAGGVLFFSSLIHHGTPPNRSAKSRKAVQLHYRSVNAQELTPDEFSHMFHDSKGVAGCWGKGQGGTVRPMDQRAF